MTQAGTQPPTPTPAPTTPAPATTPTPTPAPTTPAPTATTPTPASTPAPDLTQDLTFAEIAVHLPPGALISTAAGIELNLSAIAPGVNLSDYGVSQAIYALITAAQKAQEAANSGRLATKKLNAVTVNFTELRGNTLRFGVSLQGHANLLSNIQGVQGGI